MKKFWKVSDEVSSNGKELYIDGVISDESWWGDEATPNQLREELQAFANGQPLTVVLNSVGGDVFAGLAMYNALRELNSEVTIRVDGLAASIASVIAMAGDKIIMSPGSMMMVHRPSTIAWGNVEEMQKTIELLETIEESIFPIYADRTGLSLEEVTELVNAETWMSAERAVELGFADSLAKSVKKTVEEEPQNSMHAGFAFSMKATSEAIVKSVPHLEAEPEAPVEEQPPVETPPAEPETPEQPEEVPPTPVDDPKPEETPVEAPTETPTDEIKKPVEKKETSEMKTPVETPEGVQDKALPSQEAPVQAQAYLKSKKSIEDFAQILVEQAGKTSQDVKDAWGEHLATMGITNPDILLPDALITEIEDQFKEGGEIWNLLNKTGLTVFRAAWDTVTGENSRGKGYNRAEEEEKAEEVITLADRVLRPQFIYKYITLNKEDIKENRDTGALVRYVLSELPRRIIREVERAVVIGDGRADDSDYKISSFLSILDDAEGAGNVAVVYTPGVGESKYETLLRVRSKLKAEGAKYLVAKSEYLIEVLLEQGVNGGFLWAPGTDVARAMGFAGAIEPDWLDDTSSPDYDAFGVVFGQYRTVGDNTIEAFTNFVLKTNKQEYLQEIYAGGALTALNSGVAVAKPADS